MKTIEIGQRFEMLVVVADDGARDKQQRRLLLCKCNCGMVFRAQTSLLNRGKVKSCGCLRARGNHTSHGDTRGRDYTAEYRTWCAMIQRCTNPRNNRFVYYGARGIKVCDRWRDYAAFLADMGRKPSPAHTIDRLDVNGNYKPSNCRWASPIEQRASRRTA
jgi:hypothetical protein